MVQWITIYLPKQGTLVQSLVREDLPCHRAAKSVLHDYRARALEPVSHNDGAHVLQLLQSVCLEPVLRDK